MTMSLTEVIDPTDWHELETRAWAIQEAAGNIDYAIRMCAHDPTPARTNRVRLMRDRASKLGLTENEIGHIIWNTWKEILYGG